MTPETFYNEMKKIRTEGLVVAALHLASAPLDDERQTQIDLIMLILIDRLDHNDFNNLCGEIEDLVAA
jgi:hypothetical protein